MLMRIASRSALDAQLAALSGERISGRELTYRRGAVVFSQGDEANSVYQMISGAVRAYKRLGDGRRQISSFHLVGDMFGLENGPAHRFTAQAVTATVVRVTCRRRLFDAIEYQEAGRTKLLSLVTRNLQHAEDHMLLLGRKTALEKVAAFLLEMDERQAYPSVINLPMSRRDIADYLGLTLETVSRALSTLRDDRMLRFEGQTQRRVVLLDREGLAQLEI
ncbi:MAG: helix-turn-helix domain-containing protein [Bradyrhizobium sp.]